MIAKPPAWMYRTARYEAPNGTSTLSRSGGPRAASRPTRPPASAALAAWRALPALPRGTATLALGAAGQADAIAAHLGTFADWRLGASGWTLAQTIQVTIPYGSSG